MTTLNTFNFGIAKAAVLAESARHFDQFKDHDSVETIEATISLDSKFNIRVHPARDGGGYTRQWIAVVCAIQNTPACAAYRGSVSFIRKLGQA